MLRRLRVSGCWNPMLLGADVLASGVQGLGFRVWV